jgi:hypothetical protein
VLTVTGDVAGGFHGGVIRPETRPWFTVNRDIPLSSTSPDDEAATAL